MNSFSLFTSPNQNYQPIWKPYPTKLISQNSQLIQYNHTPISNKSPQPLNEMNFKTSYIEKSALTNKDGAIISKVDSNNPLYLQFEQVMELQMNHQPQKISIQHNYFNSKNGESERTHQFGTSLFDFNQIPENSISKSADKPTLLNQDASNDIITSSYQMKCFKSAPTKKKVTFKTEKTEMNQHNNQLNHILSFPNNVRFLFKHKGNKKESNLKNMTFIKKKRLREKSWNTKAKKLKKKDKRVETYLLNQICIDNISIAKFPMIQLPEEDLSVQLLTRMVATENYFIIVDKYYSNIPGIEEEMINNKSFIKLFNKEKEKINNELYLIDENVNETLPEVLLRNFYSQIKETILAIQKNYIGKKKNALNDSECSKLKRLIQSCNEVTNIMTDFKKSGKKTKRPAKLKKKQQHYKTYLCEFCNKAYSNGQGLGGHISRIHHNKSEKYREKIRIRNNRVDRRQLIYDIKKELFNRYRFNLDDINPKTEKKFIHSFMKDHKEEYYKIKKEVQREHKKKRAIIPNKEIEDILQISSSNNSNGQNENGNANGNDAYAYTNFNDNDNKNSSSSSSDDSSINEEAVRTLETTRVDTTYQQ